MWPLSLKSFHRNDPHGGDSMPLLKADASHRLQAWSLDPPLPSHSSLWTNLFFQYIVTSTVYTIYQSMTLCVKFTGDQSIIERRRHFNHALPVFDTGTDGRTDRQTRHTERKRQAEKDTKWDRQKDKEKETATQKDRQTDERNYEVFWFTVRGNELLCFLVINCFCTGLGAERHVPRRRRSDTRTKQRLAHSTLLCITVQTRSRQSINQSINSSFNKNTSDTDAKGFTRNKVTNIKQTWIITNCHQDYNRWMVTRPRFRQPLGQCFPTEVYADECRKSSFPREV